MCVIYTYICIYIYIYILNPIKTPIVWSQRSVNHLLNHDFWGGYTIRMGEGIISRFGFVFVQPHIPLMGLFFRGTMCRKLWSSFTVFILGLQYIYINSDWRFENWAEYNLQTKNNMHHNHVPPLPNFKTKPFTHRFAVLYRFVASPGRISPQLLVCRAA